MVTIAGVLGLSEEVDPAKERLERSTFCWVPSRKLGVGRKPGQFETISANEVAREHGCPRSIIAEYVEREVEEAAACQALPFTLLLVVSYACVVISHMDASTVRDVEHSLVHDIEENANFAFDSPYMGHKNVDDVNSYADFWSFMNKGLIPLLFIQEHVWSEEMYARNASEIERLRLRAYLANLTTTTTTTTTSTANATTSSSQGPSAGPSEGPTVTESTTSSTEAPTEAPVARGRRRTTTSTVPTTTTTTTTTTPEPFVLPVVPLNATDWGVQISYNRVIGGIRLRQERAGTAPCRARPALNVFYLRECLVDAPRQYDIDPEVDVARTMMPETAKTEWIWVYQPIELALERTLFLETHKWLDDRTTKIEVGIPIFNGELGVHTLMTVNFFFSRGGHIFKRIIAQSCYINWLTEWYHFVFDMTYVACIMWMFGTELLEIAHVVFYNGLKAIWREYVGIWNLIDWASIVFGFMLLSMFSEVLTRTEELNGAIEAVGEYERYGDLIIDEFKDVELYAEHLEQAVSLVTLFQRLLAIYPLIIVLRLFKSFHAQPRLALVTKTLQEGATDLGHFLFVLLCVFCGFVGSAMVIFGREVDELATFSRGFIYCFRLLLGDFDFDELRHVGRIPAGLWLMCFIVLLNVILMNMLMAIVMDAYSTVKADLGSAETLFEETMQQLTRFYDRRRGLKNVVSMEVVQAALTKSPEELAIGAIDLDGELELLELDPPPPKKKKKKKKKKEKEEEKEPPPLPPTREQAIEADVILREEDLINLVKKVRKSNTQIHEPYIMGTRQAHGIFVEALLDFYGKERKQADAVEYIRLAHKTDARMFKIHKSEDELQAGMAHLMQQKEENAMVEGRLPDVKELIGTVSREVEQFFRNVESDRLRATEEVVRLRAEVAALDRRLQNNLEPHREPHHREPQHDSGGHGARQPAALVASAPSALSGPTTAAGGTPKPRARFQELGGIQEEEPEQADAGDEEPSMQTGGLDGRVSSQLPSAHRDRAGPPQDASAEQQTKHRYALLHSQGLLPRDWAAPIAEDDADIYDWPDELSMPSSCTPSVAGSGSAAGSAAGSVAGAGLPWAGLAHSGDRWSGGPESGGWSGWSESGRSHSQGGSSQFGSEWGSDLDIGSEAYDDFDEQSLDDYETPDEPGPASGLPQGGMQGDLRAPMWIEPTRVADGVGLVGPKAVAISASASRPAGEPPGSYNFTSFRDAQGHLRRVQSRADAAEVNQ